MRLLGGEASGSDGEIRQVDEVPSSIRYATVLRHLAPGDLLDLGRESELRVFAPGEIMVREGGFRVEVFLLLSGQVSIRRADSTGRNHALDLREAGDWIGATGITRRIAHAATAVVETPTRALAIPKDAFVRIALASPAATRDLLELASNRLVDCVDAHLSRLELDERSDREGNDRGAFHTQTRGGLGERRSFHEATRIFQEQLIEQTLDDTDGNVSEAARRLRIARSYIYKLRSSSRAPRHAQAVDLRASSS